MSKISAAIRRANRPFCSAVILAGGASARMGEDKLFMSLCGRPVLAHTLEAFQKSPSVDEIILVTRPDRLADAAALRESCGITKLTRVVVGGKTRAESALAGVSEVSRAARLIAIHDGARPLVTEEVIAAAVCAAAKYRAAAPAVRATDTIKLAENDTVTRTLDRGALYAVQTPQVFSADIIKGALTSAVASGADVTDDCAAAELLGVNARLVPGSDENIKLTRPVDAALAEAIIKKRGEPPCE